MKKGLRCAAGAGLMLMSLPSLFAAGTIYGSAYVGSSGAASLYTINSLTGAATLVGPIGFTTVGALAFSPSGTLYGSGTSTTVDGPVLIMINTATGAGTLVGATGTSGNFQDIAFRSDGTLFGYDGGTIYRFNTTTGAATMVGSTGFGFPDGNALAFSSGSILYTANQTNLQSINQATGVATTVVALNYSGAFGTGESRAAGMKFGSDGTLWAAIVTGGAEGGGNARSLGIINLATGAVTDVGASVAGLDGLAVTGAPGTTLPPSPTPAPSSLLLLAVGITGLLAWMYRNARNAKARRTM